MSLFSNILNKIFPDDHPQLPLPSERCRPHPSTPHLQ